MNEQGENYNSKVHSVKMKSNHVANCGSNDGNNKQGRQHYNVLGVDVQ